MFVKIVVFVTKAGSITGLCELLCSLCPSFFPQHLRRIWCIEDDLFLEFAGKHRRLCNSSSLRQRIPAQGSWNIAAQLYCITGGTYQISSECTILIKRRETHNAYKEKEKNYSLKRKKKEHLNLWAKVPLFVQKLFLVPNSTGQNCRFKIHRPENSDHFWLWCDFFFSCSNQAYIWDGGSSPDSWSWGFGPRISEGIDGGWAMLSNLQNWAFREVLKIYTSEADFSHCQVSPTCNLCKPEDVLILVTEVFSNCLELWSHVHRNRSEGWSPSHKCGF